ncbi:uncharacterized protein LOC120843050 [Ixodes scapularis]|uniref:uncharacterized protein LOC120843050 n=1 Tax=Ixodes scapularis TaxID=6945 RepID=UPI001C380CC2|nr:uncharacterized protein LOC120843050 [Ixodes scapularis]
MPLFPGHRYLGPGNPLDNGQPVDRDDWIARQHDHDYSKATSDQDIFTADHKAIGDFVSDWSDRGSWHSLVGAAGLGFKNLVEEKALGRTLYGGGENMSGRKRGHDSGSSPDFKRLYGDSVVNFIERALYSGSGAAAADSSTTNADPCPTDQETSQELTQRGPGGAGIGSNTQNEGVVVQQILRVPRDQGVVSVYSDSKLLTTWGYATVLTKITYTHDKKYYGYFTSMSRLPVEFPYLYITPGTFKSLPPDTKALSCRAKITPHGIRTPWKTGSTVVQPVNSDMLVYGVSSVGLNLYLDTGMAKPGTGTTDNQMVTTEPSEFHTNDHRLLIDKYWGVSMDSSGTLTKSDTIPTCMGVPRHNNCYDFIHCADFAPRTNKFINTFPFKSHVGTPIINYDYTFQNGWLRTCAPMCGDSNTYIAAPSTVMGKQLSTLDSTIKDTSVQNSVIMLQREDFDSEYDRPIEREHSHQGLIHNPPNCSKAQPSVGFGILAVSKKSIDSPGSNDKFQDVSAFFQVDTELVLHSSNDTISPMQKINSACHQHFTKTKVNKYIPANRQTHLGHYTYHESAGTAKLLSVPFKP